MQSWSSMPLAHNIFFNLVDAATPAEADQYLASMFAAGFDVSPQTPTPSISVRVALMVRGLTASPQVSKTERSILSVQREGSRFW